MNRVPLLILAILAVCAFCLGLMTHHLLWQNQPPSYPQTPLDVARRLEVKGLHFRLETTSSPTTIYFFTGRPPSEIGNGLPRDPSDLARWRGIFLCEYTPISSMPTSLDEESECCFRIGRLLFFGDPELLARVKRALQNEAN
jgi:hypothetical protein